MKRINWNILHAALWIEIALSYLLPFKVTDDSQYQVGFPMPFISVCDRGFGKNPFMSMHVNPVGLMLDLVVIYFIILACIKAYPRIRHHHMK